MMISAIIFAATTMAAPSRLETDAIFAAAGGMRHGGRWMWSHADPAARLRIDLYRDLNADGLVDAVVAEESAAHGAAGTAFAIIVQGPKGKWRKLFSSAGVAEVLDSRGKGPNGISMWPDIRIAGPGSCFPVMRWNGKTYIRDRAEYRGKPCRL